MGRAYLTSESERNNIQNKLDDESFYTEIAKELKDEKQILNIERLYENDKFRIL
jgi:hypothetical protein